MACEVTKQFYDFWDLHDHPDTSTCWAFAALERTMKAASRGRIRGSFGESMIFQSLPDSRKSPRNTEGKASTTGRMEDLLKGNMERNIFIKSQTTIYSSSPTCCGLSVLVFGFILLARLSKRQWEPTAVGTRETGPTLSNRQRKEWMVW